MRWITLWNKLGKQPITFMQNNNVYGLFKNEKTGELEKILLDLKYDEKGHPYFIKKET